MRSNMKEVELQLKAHAKSIGCSILHVGRCKNSADTVIKCKCGAIETQVAGFILSGKAGCMECRKRIMRSNQSNARIGKQAHNRKSHSDYIKELRKANPTMKCLGEYTGCYDPLPHVCNVCKHEQDYRPLNLLRYGCRKCAGCLPKTTQSYNRELVAKDIGFEVVEYLGARIPVWHTCTKCSKYKVKASPTNMLKQGKIKCADCDGTSIHLVKFKNKTFKVRGFERFAIKSLIKHFGINNVVTDIGGGVPEIQVTKHKVHKPDFYIPSENMMVEVKSIPTMGLSNFKIFGKEPKRLFQAIKKKKKAATKMGYKYFLLLISSKGKQVKIPQDWEKLSRSKLQKIVKDLGHPLK